jgi:hypothetical protein
VMNPAGSSRPSLDAANTIVFSSGGVIMLKATQACESNVRPRFQRRSGDGSIGDSA